MQNLCHCTVTSGLKHLSFMIPYSSIMSKNSLYCITWYAYFMNTCTDCQNSCLEMYGRPSAVE